MSAKFTPCPCGAPDYAACCGRYHGGTPAPDAEALMRSRYSAYVLKLEPVCSPPGTPTLAPHLSILQPTMRSGWGWK